MCHIKHYIIVTRYFYLQQLAGCLAIDWKMDASGGLSNKHKKPDLKRKTNST